MSFATRENKRIILKLQTSNTVVLIRNLDLKPFLQLTGLLFFVAF